MNQFKEYVTSTAFKLSLSKVQIECLSQIDQLGKSWMLITTFNALSGKGLVERIPGDTEREFDAVVQLTEAGRHVIPLLKLSGLYVVMPKWPEYEQQPPIEIVIKRKTPEATKDGK